MKTKGRLHCRQWGCPNTFNALVGADGSWGKRQRGDCTPCWMAAQILSAGATLEQMARVPEMKAMIEKQLADTGWTWADLEASYARRPVVM